MNFTNGKELLELCSLHNKKIHEIMLEKEMKYTGVSEDLIIIKLQESLKIMKDSITVGIKQEVKSLSGLIGGEAKKIYERNIREKSVCGPLMSKAISRSMAVLEVNSAMGKIVAAPTAGSSGIIPGVFITVSEEFGFSDDELVKALLTASAIGFIITRNATVAGAEGGCQAETGSAAAMAAGAIVELMGGTPEKALDAASFTIKNTLGLVCDPIAGLVEAPCQMRNAIGSANALISAEMALAGVKSIIPFDEVVDTMYRVGKCMPMELRETAMGGLAATPTGKRIMKEILEKELS
ncbi:L-serine ammonia-lyase, iron-sulfur-dependent, subunit alpha [Serpentinicella alkaliphila]|uniref:L-serine dehydratase n=1 Tax=Serpentinicella alkaliphila TaxID=1734049 RepID=A0A4R2TVG2_9FIRM|nr:L-serine ammonia-lyase, iron-sulfur-dependent, subunit alpha [Serpentinicella alkaliphila]QUH26750.1 L-serine ammonia-lyase, iron-sulfur-dependent, subunit alpha [Serpentinicella alkaliphila]TCQ07970.1 L-serine ammonia-lyase [Serpentinicella alkaliphila]